LRFLEGLAICAILKTAHGRPIALVADAILDSSRRGDIVLDPSRRSAGSASCYEPARSPGRARRGLLEHNRSQALLPSAAGRLCGLLQWSSFVVPESGFGRTDPPYNVPIDGHVSGLGKTHHREFAMG
jgi:hypothetical protein